MRTWIRAAVHEFCGGCGGEIPKDTVCLELRFLGPENGPPFRKVRCEMCTGERAPEILVVAQKPAGIKARPSFTRLGTVLSFDFKQASTGERDE